MIGLKLVGLLGLFYSKTFLQWDFLLGLFRNDVWMANFLNLPQVQHGLRSDETCPACSQEVVVAAKSPTEQKPEPGDLPDLRRDRSRHLHLLAPHHLQRRRRRPGLHLQHLHGQAALQTDLLQVRRPTFTTGCLKLGPNLSYIF